MHYSTHDLSHAALCKDRHLFTNDLARYDLCIDPVRKVQNKNVYNLMAVATAHLIGSLKLQGIPMSGVSQMFSRIDFDALAIAVDQFEAGHIDTVAVVFLAFEPDEEDFTGVVTDLNDVAEIIQTFGTCLTVDCSDFLKAKIEGLV